MRIYRIRKFPARLFLPVLIIVVIIFGFKISPALKSFTLETLSKPLGFFSSIKKKLLHARFLSEENLLLKQRIAALSVDLARTKGMEAENKRLRALLGFKKRQRLKTVAARVMARDSVDWRKSLIIDKGEKDGIRVHMPCATAKGFIGSVIEVGPHTSKVMLITDPNSRVGVVVEPSRESGLLIGSPDGLCRVIYLSIDAVIDRGSLVLTAGFGPFLPKGLRIGSIIAGGIGKTGLYQYAIIDPFEDVNRIEEVICIDAGQSF